MIELISTARIKHTGRQEYNLYRFRIENDQDEKLVLQQIKDWANQHLAFDPHVFPGTLRKTGDHMYEIMISTYVD